VNQAIKDLFANNKTITRLGQKRQERMRKLFSYAAISVAAMLSLPAIAMPGKFDSLDNATFCSVDQGHSVILIDSKGTTAVRPGQSACITLTKIEDVWKVRIEWWSQPMNKRFVEYALAGWINPSTLSYIEAPSNPTASKIVGTGQLRFIDADTIHFFQNGVLDNGSSALFNETLTRVTTAPTVNIPLQE